MKIIIDQETGKKYKLVEIKDFKFAFVVGHTQGPDKGAFSPFLGKTEFDLWKSFADGFLSDIGDVFTHDHTITSYGGRQEDTAAKTNNYQVVFELHFNSASLSANGCEALYYKGNEKGKKIAEKYCSLMAAKMNYKNRGAKPITQDDRGGKFVTAQKPTALILEPFFGSNPDDCSKFKAIKYKEVIEELCEFIKTL